MYWRVVKNDLLHQPLRIFPIAFFILLSVSFLGAAGQLGWELSGALRSLEKKAKTPHMVQMHTGGVDRERMAAFAGSHSEIEEYQILEFLNIDNRLLAMGDHSLKDSVYDNGFSVQSPSFDFLLDLEGEIIKPEPGEVYVPLVYKTTGEGQEGDILLVGDYPLRIAGFVRDSQMNSSLSVSRRFLLHEKDYQALLREGTLEYLIEFRLQTPRDAGKIEAAYAEAGLEAEGPPFLTAGLFTLANAFTDGIVVAGLGVIGLLIIAIALTCIRFTLLGRLEEDYREQAVLRAIGLPLSIRRQIFLGKYLFVAGASSGAGILASFFIKGPFLSNIRLFFGEGGGGGILYLIALLPGAGIFLFLVFRMRSLAKGLKNLPMNPVLVGQKKKKSKSLSDSLLPFFLSRGIRDILSDKKLYSTMILVLVLSVFVLNFPMTLFTTVSDRRFVSYLGLGSYDVRMDLSQLEGREEEVGRLLERLSKDERVEDYTVYRSYQLDYRTEGGGLEKLWIDFGDWKKYPVSYGKGRAPGGEEEIALSALKAREMEKNIGDTILLVTGEGEKRVRVCGIFSSLTNGGKTARAGFSPEEGTALWMILPLSLRKGSDFASFMEEYTRDFPFAKMADMETYLNQIFGGTIRSIGRIAAFAFAASMLLVFLITLLFIRMIFAREEGEAALQKALGFSNRRLRLAYGLRILLVLTAGLAAGNVLEGLLGDALGGAALSLTGISGIQFIRHPLFSYLLVPLFMTFSTLPAVLWGTGGLEKMNIQKALKEDV